MVLRWRHPTRCLLMTGTFLILKIDRSFVADLSPSADESTLTGAILTLARSLKLGQIAEGAEDAARAR
jgi:EAL domain-containing protein (putative c-di-GMP-specific phosphodiesterase class I)